MSRVQYLDGTERRVRVWCSQWASCRWAGYRKMRDRRDLSVLDKPCPKCGKEVVR